jgi:hypothetical protein
MANPIMRMLTAKGGMASVTQSPPANNNKNKAWEVCALRPSFRAQPVIKRAIKNTPINKLNLRVRGHFLRRNNLMLAKRESAMANVLVLY